MKIENIILRHCLKNVYFITGTAYAGKSTMVKMLAERYDMGTSKNPFERKRAIHAEYFVKSPRLAPASLRSLSSSSTRLSHFLFSKRFLEVPI